MNDNESSHYDNLKHNLREAILAAIDSSSNAMTSSEIHKAITPHTERVAVGTIIRMIYDLVNDDLIAPVTRSKGSRRYQRTSQPTSPGAKVSLPPRGSGSSHVLSLVPVSDGFDNPSLNAGDIPPKIRIAKARRQLPSTAAQHSPFSNSPMRTGATANDFARYLDIIRPTLDAIREKRLPNPFQVVFPPDMDRTALRDLPLRVRTWNCLETAGMFEGQSLVTVADLLQLRNFGRVSLRDLLLCVEDYLQTRAHETASAPRDTPDNQLGDESSLSDNPRGHGDLSEETSLPTSSDPFSRLLIAAATFHGYVTLDEILSPTMARLADNIGVSCNLRRIEIRDVAIPHTSNVAVVLRQAQELYGRLTSRQKTVLVGRFLESPRKSLKELRTELGLTRQRIHQIRAKIELKLASGFGAELREIAAVLKEEFGPMARTGDVDRKIAALFVEDGSRVPEVARYVVRHAIGYSRRMKGMYLHADAYAEVQRLRSSAKVFSKDGIIDETRLKDSVAGDGWLEHWSLLLKCCAFNEIFGLLSLRNSDRVRTKAALMSIGAPATREEIASLCGLSVSRVGAYLSGFSDIVRSDKWRWGLAAWVDDEYEGIEAEIVQRIEEGGGVASTNRLVEELPRKFGVSAGSVRSYLQRPMFSVRGNHVTLKVSFGTDSVDLHDIPSPELPRAWKIQAALRCGAICGFGLSPRIMKDLLELRSTSLLELHFFLTYGLSDSGLERAIRTDSDREVVKDTYVQFEELLLTCNRDGRVSTDKIVWIVPSDYSAGSDVVGLDEAEMVDAHLGRALGRSVWSNIRKHVWEWLPWIPLSVVTHLRSWSNPRISSLRRALFKLVSDVNYAEQAFYPWDPKFPQEIRFIPIQALYQYEASSATLAMLRTLRDCGIRSVNDLRCFHPDAVLAAKHKNQPLFQIHRDVSAMK